MTNLIEGARAAAMLNPQGLNANLNREALAALQQRTTQVETSASASPVKLDVFGNPIISIEPPEGPNPPTGNETGIDAAEILTATPESLAVAQLSTPGAPEGAGSSNGGFSTYQDAAAGQFGEDYNWIDMSAVGVSPDGTSFDVVGVAEPGSSVVDGEAVYVGKGPDGKFYALSIVDYSTKMPAESATKKEVGRAEELVGGDSLQFEDMGDSYKIIVTIDSTDATDYPNGEETVKYSGLTTVIIGGKSYTVRLGLINKNGNIIEGSLVGQFPDDFKDTAFANSDFNIAQASETVDVLVAKASLPPGFSPTNPDTWYQVGGMPFLRISALGPNAKSKQLAKY